MPKMTLASPADAKRITLLVPTDKVEALMTRVEGMTGVRVSQSVLLRRALDVLEDHLEARAAQLAGGRYAERQALEAAARH